MLRLGQNKSRQSVRTHSENIVFFEEHLFLYGGSKKFYMGKKTKSGTKVGHS